MKTKKTVITLSVLALLFAGLFSSCYTPNPLYGTWTDNIGNTLTIRGDGTFSSTITNSMGNQVQYAGSWSCFENVLSFVKDTGAKFNTEWDVRGAILSLTWVDDKNVSLSMTLYHTSKN